MATRKEVAIAKLYRKGAIVVLAVGGASVTGGLVTRVAAGGAFKQ